MNEHGCILRQARDSKGRAWEPYCVYCGWVGAAKYDILNARNMGIRHVAEMAEEDD